MANSIYHPFTFSGNESRHFHVCSDCGFEYECVYLGWTEYCNWHDLVPQDQRCSDCEKE